MDPVSEHRIESVTREVMALLGTADQVEPFTRRFKGFDLAEAYAVAARVCHLRAGRGEKPVGRKIGFTNRAVWRQFAISAPIWNYVFDRTVSRATDGCATMALAGMPEPRIEPEIALHLAADPLPGMEGDALKDCVDWAAPAFEVVYSVFPDWQFAAADAVAAFGVHGALILGEEIDLRHGGPVDLAAVDVELDNGVGLRCRGAGRNALGGPLKALRFLVDEIARYPIRAPLRAGDIVTTGTLTEAMPVAAGERWTARFDGNDAGTLRLDFR